MKGRSVGLLGGAPAALALTCGCARVVPTPDIATRIAEACSSVPCQVRLDSVVSGAWDTVWLVNQPLQAELDRVPGLPPEARKTLGEWDDGLGKFNVMVGTLDGRVAWSEACGNNIDENFEPELCWWVSGDGGVGWARASRGEAVFDVVRRVGPTENSLLLRPVPTTRRGAPGGP